jgi:L-ascorbate metabolism protein UlaG (beta-lactamase superfamily)
VADVTRRDIEQQARRLGSAPSEGLAAVRTAAHGHDADIEMATRGAGAPSIPAADSIMFIGTATTLIRCGGFTILTDPNLLHRGQAAYLGYGLWSRRRTEPALPPGGLPPLDAVVLSHMHGDHFDRVAAACLDRDTPILTTHHAAGRLRRRGFREPVPLGVWESQVLRRDDRWLSVTALPGHHAHGLLERLLPPVMGSLLEFGDGSGRRRRLYITGDTLYDADLRAIGERFPDIDLAILHLGGTRILRLFLVTMDGRQGVDLLELIRPAAAIPVHYDDYSVFRSPLSDFEAELERRRPAVRVHRLPRGETLPWERPEGGA